MNQVLQDAFDQHREALLGYVQKRLQDAQQAQDLMQDLYLKLTTQASTTDIQYPKAYLYRMANNLVIDIQRRHARQPINADAETELEQFDELSPERQLDAAQQLQNVTDAINQLPHKTRDVFRMQRLQQLDKADVAEQLGISVNMVEKHLRRALQYCRNKLYKLE